MQKNTYNLISHICRKGERNQHIIMEKIEKNCSRGWKPETHIKSEQPEHVGSYQMNRNEFMNVLIERGGWW